MHPVEYRICYYTGVYPHAVMVKITVIVVVVVIIVVRLRGRRGGMYLLNHLWVVVVVVGLVLVG